jgi:hypothetical protein
MICGVLELSKYHSNMTLEFMTTKIWRIAKLHGFNWIATISFFIPYTNWIHLSNVEIFELVLNLINRPLFKMNFNFEIFELFHSCINCIELIQFISFYLGIIIHSKLTCLCFYFSSLSSWTDAQSIEILYFICRTKLRTFYLFILEMEL